MNSLVSHIDFVGDCQLSIDSYKSNQFNDFIQARQAELLRSLLGIEEYNLMAAADITETKYANLIDGCDYVVGSTYYHFTGVKEILKYFVYFHWLRSTFIPHTPAGHVQNLTENSTAMNPSMQMTYVNNRCLDLCSEFQDYMDQQSTDFPKWDYNAPFAKRFNILGI
jgi:hypothetical protein